MRCLIFAALLATAFAAKSYEGYKVFSFTPKDTLELDTALYLQKGLTDYADFWKSPSRAGASVDMMVAPENQKLVLDFMRNRNVDVDVRVENVQTNIDKERSEIQAGFSYTNFNTLADINSWMDDMAAQHPTLVSVVNVGTSYEGRTIRALKIGKSGLLKDAVWYEAGIHPREWISPATLIYMTKLLIDGYGSDNDVTTILNTLDVYMLPVYNVDGYEYTWTSDRYWRKTRSGTGVCKGADPNRNWNFQWGGESNFQCAETYQGPRANSEVEVDSVSSYIAGLGSRVKVFIDFHAYGLMWMTPWGYSKIYPSDYTAQVSLCNDAVAALTAVEGTQYETGTIANTIYIATGSSADWAYGVAGIKYSYAVELRGNDFVISRTQIQPSGVETFEALKVISLAVC